MKAGSCDYSRGSVFGVPIYDVRERFSSVPTLHKAAARGETLRSEWHSSGICFGTEPQIAGGALEPDELPIRRHIRTKLRPEIALQLSAGRSRAMLKRRVV